MFGIALSMGTTVNQKETFMSRQPTSEEIAAARALGDAILQFVIACKNGERAVREIEDRKIAPPEPKPSQEKRLLSVREAAEFLSVGERTVWAITEPRGALKAMRFGRIVRYRIEDILDFGKKGGS
jgi:excisionase family DNA binding protein